MANGWVLATIRIILNHPYKIMYRSFRSIAARIQTTQFLIMLYGCERPIRFVWLLFLFLFFFCIFFFIFSVIFCALATFFFLCRYWFSFRSKKFPSFTCVYEFALSRAREIFMCKLKHWRWPNVFWCFFIARLVFVFIHLLHILHILHIHQLVASFFLSLFYFRVFGSCWLVSLFCCSFFFLLSSRFILFIPHIMLV